MSFLDSIQKFSLVMNPSTSALMLAGLAVSSLSGCSADIPETEENKEVKSIDCSNQDEVSKYEIGQSREFVVYWHRLGLENGHAAGIGRKKIEDYIKVLNQAYQPAAHFKLAPIKDIPGDTEINYHTKFTSENFSQFKSKFFESVQGSDYLGTDSAIVVFSSESVRFLEKGEAEGYLGRFSQNGIFYGGYMFLSKKGLANPVVLAHEFGHTFGLSHTSSGKTVDQMNQNDSLHCADQDCNPVMCTEENKESYNFKNYMSNYADDAKCQETFDAIDLQKMACVMDQRSQSLKHLDTELVSAPQAPNKIFVSNGQSIQNAIEEAKLNFSEEGGRIIIESGTYLQNINLIGIDFPLALEGKEEVVIDGIEEGRPVLEIQDSGTEASRIEIKNFTLTGGKVWVESQKIYKAYIRKSYVNMENCKIMGDTSGGVWAVSSTVDFKSSQFKNSAQEGTMVFRMVDSQVLVNQSSFTQNISETLFNLVASNLKIHDTDFSKNQLMNSTIFLSKDSSDFYKKNSKLWINGASWHGEEALVCLKPSQSNASQCHDVSKQDVVICNLADNLCESSK